MKFIDKVKKEAVKFSQGRYGMDRLNVNLQFLSLPMLILGIIFKYPWLILLTFILLSIINFRSLSKNIRKRQEENRKYLELTSPFRKEVKLIRSRIKDRKTHRYLSCPKCNENLRLPKNKGKIRITCPKCKHQFEKRV